ncbi:MAG TPA: FadR/GntR family transcriptional regulator [Aestuariivirga sp.]|nr:FadR family transcriptional regulator [Alphaproteobacteria bacterium]HRX35185.1 FadR/GntR family transcriptional regulator [Aestuariivirga sp.]
MTTMRSRRPTFSAVVAGKLKDMIGRRKLKPGDRIPTEAELCEMYGVSRTVVREAIMSLRSEGQLVARQGIGVFVAETNIQRFEVDWNAIRTLPKTIMLIELRMAVETEAAGLCAVRRSKADAIDIRRRMEKVDAERREPKVTNLWYDQQFHLTIAKASKNPHIYQLLKMMAPVAMPRMKLGAVVDDSSKDSYYRMIHAEHERIVIAIEEKKESQAREAMRDHIAAVIERMRKLTASLPEESLRDAYEANPALVQSLVRGVAPEID